MQLVLKHYSFGIYRRAYYTSLFFCEWEGETTTVTIVLLKKHTKQPGIRVFLAGWESACLLFRVRRRETRMKRSGSAIAQVTREGIRPKVKVFPPQPSSQALASLR